MACLELAPAKRQRTWGWPAVVNLTLGGTGAGLYLLGMLLAPFSQAWTDEGQFVAFALLAAAVVGLGFLTLALEAGRPLRAYRLFRRLSGSWMSVESLAGLLFIVSAVASYWLPAFPLQALAMLAAVVLIVSQGWMLNRAVGVSAWNRRLIPWLFVTSGLVSAGGLLLLNARHLAVLDRLPILMLASLVLLNLAVWLRYLFGRTEDGCNWGIQFLRRPVLLLFIAGMGHLLPILHMGAILLSGDLGTSIVATDLFRVGSGLLLIAGSACQKIGIVLAAGFHRPIVIEALFKYDVSMPTN